MDKLLSVCMIVKDEEKHIARCLKSVSAIADEIIVVDTGSTDRTVEIAKEFGATVLFHQWTGDFDKARNVSLSAATGKWILWVDGDDEVPEASAKRIDELKREDDGLLTAYMVKVRNISPVEISCSNEFNSVRMIRNGKGYEFRGRVHERLDHSIKELGGTAGVCSDVVIYHHGYQSEDVVCDKVLRNIRLLLTDTMFPRDTVFDEFRFGKYWCFYANDTLTIHDITRGLDALSVIKRERSTDAAETKEEMMGAVFGYAIAEIGNIEAAAVLAVTSVKTDLEAFVERANRIQLSMDENLTPLQRRRVLFGDEKFSDETINNAGGGK